MRNEAICGTLVAWEGTSDRIEASGPATTYPTVHCGRELIGRVGLATTVERAGRAVHRRVGGEHRQHEAQRGAVDARAQATCDFGPPAVDRRRERDGVRCWVTWLGGRWHVCCWAVPARRPCTTPTARSWSCHARTPKIARCAWLRLANGNLAELRAPTWAVLSVRLTGALGGRCRVSLV